MVAQTKMKFAGFGKSTTKLLTELADNNNRAWFLENKHRYESDVQGVALDYIAAMGPYITKLSEHFLALPQKSGGSLTLSSPSRTSTSAQNTASSTST